MANTSDDEKTNQEIAQLLAIGIVRLLEKNKLNSLDFRRERSVYGDKENDSEY